MGEDFKVRVMNPTRAREWETMFGTSVVHVKSPVPTRADLPGHSSALIYELDLALLTGSQRQKLVAHLAAKFELTEDSVAAELDAQGVPILADDCVVIVANPQRWFVD